MGPADRMAAVVPGEAVARAMFILHPFVANDDEVLFAEFQRRVVEYAVGERRAGDRRPKSAAAIELEGTDAGSPADGCVALPHQIALGLREESRREAVLPGA